MAILRTGQIKPKPIVWILALNPFSFATLALGSLTFAPSNAKNHLFSANLKKWAQKIKAQQNHDNNDESKTNSRKNVESTMNISRDWAQVQGQTPNTQKMCSPFFLYYSKPFSRSLLMQNSKRWRYSRIIRPKLMIYRRRKKKTIVFSGENAIVSIGCGSLNQMLSHHLLSHFIYLMAHLCVRRKSQPEKKIHNGTWLYAFVIYFFVGFVRAF